MTSSTTNPKILLMAQTQKQRKLKNKYYIISINIFIVRNILIVLIINTILYSML